MDTQYRWIDVFGELAHKLLEFEEKPAELLRIFRYATALTKIGPARKWEGIEPFSVLAAIAANRATSASGRTVLFRLQESLGLPATAPDHYRGCVALDGSDRGFLPAIARQAPHDLACLWQLARAATIGGLRAVDPEWIDACLAIRGMNLTKLSVGLSLLNPRAFLPVTQGIENYLLSRGISGLEEVTVGDAYLRYVEKIQWVMGDDLVALVERSQRPAAHNNVEPPRGTARSEGTSAPPQDEALACIVRRGTPRFFAGGYHVQERPLLREVLEGRYWQVPYAIGTTDPAGLRCWRRFREIRCGDGFVLKGLLFDDRMMTFRAGIVSDIDPLQGRLQLAVCDVPLYEGPLLPTGRDDASWFHSLLEVTDPNTITRLLCRAAYAGQDDAERAAGSPEAGS